PARDSLARGPRRYSIRPSSLRASCRHRCHRVPRRPAGRSDGAGEGLRRLALLGDAALETVGDQLARQVAADENDAAVPFLIGLPWPLVVSVENHVHALKDEALLVVLESENAFAAQNVRPLLLHQVLHPGKEFVRIERLLGAQRNRLHFLIVIVLKPAMRMRVTILVAVMMPMIMVVVVMMIVIVGA